MHAKSSNFDAIKINPDVKTAIIYSIDEVFSYLVEIRAGDKSYYICNQDNEPIQFGNIESARRAAIKEKVQEAYLALSKTYEENDMSTCHAERESHYDFSPVPLRAK